LYEWACAGWYEVVRAARALFWFTVEISIIGAQVLRPNWIAMAYSSFRRRTVLLSLALLPVPVMAGPMVVRYWYVPVDAVRYGYYYELLEAAMQTTEAEFGPYRVERDTSPMSSARWNAEAIRGIRVNVLWSDVGHPEVDEGMIPVAVPADRGVHGYRVLLIRKDRQQDFDSVRTLSDMRRFVVGQGENWGDIKIFKANGLRVSTAPKYDLLFSMLDARRFDYFSRSVLEAPVEIDTFGRDHPDLAIERGLLLHYRFPVVYYVSKRYPELARRMQAGLEKMVANGSLQILFDRHFGATLARLDLPSRRIIELTNPFLPGFVPLARPEYWYNPLSNPKK
jgi:hypothetical protein